MRAANQQQGVVLLLALILMLVLSVAGLAAMQMARLELQMGGGIGESSRSRQLVEAALKQMENTIVGHDFAVNSAGELCRSVSNQCFNSQCTGGRCFFGSYVTDPDNPDSCVLPPRLDRNETFQDRSVWLDSNKHQRFEIEIESSGEVIPILGLIEWRCFTPLNPRDVTNNNENRFDSAFWQPLFRITAYTPGRSGQARLMAQTTVGRDTGRLSWREVPLLFLP